MKNTNNRLHDFCSAQGSVDDDRESLAGHVREQRQQREDEEARSNLVIGRTHRGGGESAPAKTTKEEKTG